MLKQIESLSARLLVTRALFQSTRRNKARSAGEDLHAERKVFYYRALSPQHQPHHRRWNCMYDFILDLDFQRSNKKRYLEEEIYSRIATYPLTPYLAAISVYGL
jgi:hypothetical protein